ncbi:hypothetical protein ANMWB30_24680 [Arthrobacter sp. MWB30]|nr:hypothetical protein ANMWB30_24680 [Arthrobacter sp. MWB30]
MTQPTPETQQSAFADALFPSFYANSGVQLLADHPRWTVSDSEKMPIDMRHLLTTGLVRGAFEISDSCLVTLSELNAGLPNAANNAFYLQAQSDGLLILDIEKTCPPDIAAELLAMPETLYSELSMSGHGYHLLLPLPPNFWDYPIATGKKVLREEHGHYEILLEHWTTFTRLDVPADRYFPPGDDVLPQAPAWADLYASLAAKAVETPSVELDITTDKPEIPRETQIIELMTRMPHAKKLEKFHNDYSRWEYSILGVLYNRLKAILVAVREVAPDHPFGESDQVWLLYIAAQKVIPHRSKHDEFRNGMPLLMNAAASLVAQRMAEADVKSKTSA